MGLCRRRRDAGDRRRQRRRSRRVCCARAQRHGDGRAISRKCDFSPSRSSACSCCAALRPMARWCCCRAPATASSPRCRRGCSIICCGRTCSISRTAIPASSSRGLSLAANGVRDSLQVLVQGLARDVLSVAGLVAVMFWRDPLIAVLALCALPVAALFLGRVIRRVRAFAKRSFDGSTQIMQTMAETVLGMRIVKSFNLEDEMRERMSAAIRIVERSANRMAAGGAACDADGRFARRAARSALPSSMARGASASAMATSARSSRSSAR